MEKLSNSEREEFIINWFYYILNYWRNISSEIALFISCQFALESNYGNSNLALKHYNLSGMRKPLIRPTVAISEDCNGFATYTSYNDCITDYMLCIAYHKPFSYELRCIGYYISFIKKFYSPEQDYVSRIENIYNQYSYLLTNQN